MTEKTRLIVTRKVGESIFVGDDVKITLGKVNEYGQHPLIIEAPREIKIDRLEVRERNNYKKDFKQT